MPTYDVQADEPAKADGVHEQARRRAPRAIGQACHDHTAATRARHAEARAANIWRQHSVQRNCTLLHAPEERHDDDAARALQRLGRDLLDDLLVALVLLALALGVRDAAREVAVVVGLRAVAEGAEDARGLLDLALGQLGGPEALCAGAIGELVDA